MTDHRGTGRAARRGGWAGVNPATRRSLQVSVLASVLGGVTATGMLVERPAVLAELLQVPWWVLALLFAVSEAFTLRIRVRGQIEAVSLSEVPLVIGLFLAPPEQLLAARVLGSIVVFVFYHRNTLLKTAFNTALVGAGTTTGLVVFTLLLREHDPMGPWGVVAALAAAVLGGLLDGAMLALVVGWYDGRRPPAEVIRELVLSALVPAVVALAGLASVLALTRGATALPLVLTGAAAVAGYRAFAVLADRHASLERLYQLSDALAAAREAPEVLASVLTQSADLLRSEYAELVLTDGGEGEALRWSFRLGEEIAGPHPASGVLMPPMTLSGGQVIDGATSAERAFLASRAVSEVLVVPVRIDARAAGHLLVADRRGEERSFTPAEGRLLETVANHASVALQNASLIDRLHFEARHDELTGLPNRLLFRDLLDDLAGAAATGGLPVAVMVLDFDGFKAINDTLGHQAGDELLRVVAGRLRDVAGTDTTVARLGGDEFAAITTAWVTADAAMELAGRLLSVFDEPVAVAGTRLRLGGSLGIALGPRDGATGSDLLRSADIAMYAAKGGAGGARLFTKDLVEVTATALTLASDLRDAVERDEVGIAVQPLVDLVSGQVHSVEVLARWTHPDLGEIAPEAFFSAAERSGQIMTLSARILDQALALCREWHSRGTPLRVAVNLAPRWLADITLPEQIGLALARHSVPAGLLCLEITENSVITDPRRAVHALGRLRDMGVHLSVDDFGTGYSSLTYLSRLPVDQMKIDKSFVLRLRENPRDRAIVRSIVDLGRNLGLEVVAEGVTDPGTRRALQEMGCALGQGYLFSRPVPPADLADVVGARGCVEPTAAAALSLDRGPAGDTAPELLGRPPAPRESDPFPEVAMPRSRSRPPTGLP